MLIDAAHHLKNYWRHPTNLIALEFGVVSFSFTAIHNIFTLYFVDLFVFKYGLDFYWLFLSQVCFVIWNFVSNSVLGDPKRSSQYEMMITYGGPALAVVFLLPFVFQISTSKLFIGIYFTLFLCLYDTLLNRVLLSRSMWLQENVVNMRDKVKIHFLGFIFASVASCSVFPSYLYYEKWARFRWFCLCVSMLSFFGFLFSSFCHLTRDGETIVTKSPHKSQVYLKHSNYKEETEPSTSASVGRATLIRNVLTHKNMLIYLGVNCMQVFSSTYSVVFLQLFITRMVATDTWWRAFVLFICFFSPVLTNIILSAIGSKRETYDLLKFLFQVKIGISFFALVFGNHIFVAVLFTIFSRAIVESVFGLLMFVNQDVDNEHHVKFGYRKASQRLVGLGKVGQAAAPIVGVLSFVDWNPHPADIPYQGSGDEAAKASDTGLFYSTILVMLLTGFLQLYIWKQYTLRGGYLKDIGGMAKGKISMDSTENSVLRTPLGDSIFTSPPSVPSPNMSSTATLTHKQVITVV